MKHIIKTAILIAIANQAYAEEHDKLLYSAFISQSVVRSSNSVQYGPNSTNGMGSISRREIGGSLSYEVSEFIDLRAMASSVNDNGNDGKVRLNYALIDVHAPSGMTGARIGRYSYNYGFYNETRNTPVYRDMEFPAQGLYRDGFRYMTRSGDGVQVYTKYTINQRHSIEADAGIGRPVLYPQQDLSQTFVLDKDAGYFTNDSTVKSINLALHDRTGGWTLKYGYLLMDYRFSSQYIDNGEQFPMRPRSHYIGLRKYFDCGDMTLEYMRTKMGDTKWDAISSPVGYEWGGVEGFAVTYKHYITSNLSGIIGYDQWLVNSKDPYGDKMQTASGGVTPAAAMHHHSINTGIVYRKQSYAIKGEFHHVRGTNTVRASGNEILASGTPSMYNVFSVSFAYAF